MKSNSVDQKTRLENRIHKLERKLDSAWGRFHKGNPYRKCNGCDRAEPEISNDGHGPACWVKGVLKEIEHYEELIKKG